MAAPLFGSKTATDPWPDKRFISQPARFPARAVLFRQSEPVSQLYLVDQGFVKLTIPSLSGGDFIVGLRTTGWLLGASSAILGRSFQTTAETISECRLRMLALRDFRTLSASDAEVGQWLHRMPAREWIDQIAVMGIRSGGSDAQRSVEGLLIRIAKASNSINQDGSIRLTVPLKHWEIAQMVPVSAEHFSRIVGHLENDDLIRREKGWLVIPQNSRLYRAVKRFPEAP